MEIRARYVLIGLFTLAVMLAGFGFVYWLNNAGALMQRSAFRIQYEKTVSGLLKGSAVLFNGIRVGEVTALDLDPAFPRRIVASIAVERSTPVRADTRAAIEFQGLTGAPVVALYGGDAKTAALVATGAEPPLLVADPNTGLSVTEAARETLRHIDGVVTENAEPLRNLVNNLSTFSNALARNTDRVDGIVAGLQRMTGGGPKVTPRIFELTAVRTYATAIKVPPGQLLVPEPSGLGTFDTDKIMLRGADGEKSTLDNAQWPDVIPKLLQSRILQSFENAGYLRTFGRAPDGTVADHQLLVDLRQFHASTAAPPAGEVELAAKVVRNDGRIVAAQVFNAKVAAVGAEPQALAAAIDQAFGKVIAELVPWACAAM